MPTEEVSEEDTWSGDIFMALPREQQSLAHRRMPDGFHPGNDIRAKFARCPISGNLQDVPGIGAAAIARLAMDDEGSITNTYQLIGRFLALCSDTLDPVEHFDRFWQWLGAKGIKANRRVIMSAVAEKVDLSFPGVYDPDIYDK